MNYQDRKATRRENRTLAGRFRGGKLTPVMALPFKESESAMVEQTVTFELDPVAGRMITPITAGVACVFVPVQAIDALKNPDQDYAGNTEAVREKLLSGTPLFGLENESEISKRLGVVPRSIGGVKQVNEAARLAHNCAVNHLRRLKYVHTELLTSTAMTVTPALISETVLDRLNGVLDPEDRVNGLVSLEMQGQNAVVHSVNKSGAGAGSFRSPAGDSGDEPTQKANGGYEWSNMIWAKVTGGALGDISLTDFYNAEKMDMLTRQMREMLDNNPQHGEEMVTRWAHGLSVDAGRTPFVVYQREDVLGQNYRMATDGPNLDAAQTDIMGQVRFSVPIPATELGGVLVTFAYIKPDEALAAQPHPILSDVWSATNYVADEMALDPVPVRVRELHADCAAGDENSIALYVGHNHMQKNYLNYGFNRHMNLNDVAQKTAIWQLRIPMSVTPQSVIYPDDISHYPFADEQAEVCTYTATCNANFNTPMIFGPTPVEELAEIEDENLFEDQ